MKRKDTSVLLKGKKGPKFSHETNHTHEHYSHLSSVDAERKQLASSSFAARVLLFHFLVLLSFENCFYCFCRRRSRTSENGRHTFFAHDASAYVFEEHQHQQQQIFPGFRSVLSVAFSENEKNNTSESYERRVVFRVASSRWSSVGFVFGGGFIVFVCVLIDNKHGLRGVDSRRGVHR